jgi:hypothetical protein
MFVHCFFKIGYWFYGFYDSFFKVTQNFSLFRDNTSKQMCCERRRIVVCEVVNFIVIFHTFYALFFWLAVFRSSYNNIFLLFLASTHF